MDDDDLPWCVGCYSTHVGAARAALAVKDGRPVLCPACGERRARAELSRKASMCQPINKSAPTYISDPELLKQLNPKRVSP